MLTAEGALQHLRLGKYFRHRYEKTKLFADGGIETGNSHKLNIIFQKIKE